MRRQDTTKGPPLRILSLDGGGVRGYSMLILLQELMHLTFVDINGRAPRRYEIPRPCEHFDLIAGTGTGGLIAIMLGRLRMDLDTCMDVYVRMTKKVFETDKTFAGIPYRSTLFKASKLEEAIRQCVREHTLSQDEGNDKSTDDAPVSPILPPDTPRSGVHGVYNNPQRSLSSASRTSSSYPQSMARSRYEGMQWGNPDALLYDSRENRTKTAVTAVYKGTPMDGSSALLRSYDSRKEPPPEVIPTIWQAGRATSATGLAFKPIQIGQLVYIDEGSGKYNPTPQILDEAVLNEWPARDVGVLVSIGTGKRGQSSNQNESQWWESALGGTMGDFVEAKRRLMSKIEGCEQTHLYMLREHLEKRNVDVQNYIRLNVEVGVGEYGMNEWRSLSSISTNTRQYLAKPEVQAMNASAAGKLARIHRAKVRHDRVVSGRPNSWEIEEQPRPAPELPNVVELPSAPVYEIDSRPTSARAAHQYQQFASAGDKFAVVSDDLRPPDQYVRQSYHSAHEFQPHGDTNVQIPPPLPPKTPLQPTVYPVPAAHPPYPSYDPDAPPPTVNMASKPLMRN